jgi:DNA-binding response OmpR family regulator
MNRLLASFALALSLTSIGLADPKPTTTACPDPVKAAISRLFPKSTITTCKSENEHGTTQFEVKVTKADSTKAEVDVSAEGKVLQIEEKVPVASVPPAVMKAFAARYPKAKVRGPGELRARLRGRRRSQGSDVHRDRHLRRRGVENRSMRVLVVEDYQLLRESLASGLKQLGYAVDASGDGAEGLWYAENHPYDVVILDLMLPKLGGLELLRKIRDAGKTVPVLVLTAKDAIEDRVAGLDRGADDYLVKPFAFDELAARLRALVRRRYERDVPVIRIGDLEIDTRARSVRRGDEVIVLSAREYALLEYLANRTGHIVTRTEIWDHVYDAADEPWSNVLDVHISHLRRKIDHGRTVKLIHTRRGQGYLLGDHGDE